VVTAERRVAPIAPACWRPSGGLTNRFLAELAVLASPALEGRSKYRQIIPIG